MKPLVILSGIILGICIIIGVVSCYCKSLNRLNENAQGAHGYTPVDISKTIVFLAFLAIGVVSFVCFNSPNELDLTTDEAFIGGAASEVR